MQSVPAALTAFQVRPSEGAEPASELPLEGESQALWNLAWEASETVVSPQPDAVVDPDLGAALEEGVDTDVQVEIQADSEGAVQIPLGEVLSDEGDTQPETLLSAASTASVDLLNAAEDIVQPISGDASAGEPVALNAEVVSAPALAAESLAQAGRKAIDPALQQPILPSEQPLKQPVQTIAAQSIEAGLAAQNVQAAGRQQGVPIATPEAAVGVAPTVTEDAELLAKPAPAQVASSSALPLSAQALVATLGAEQEALSSPERASRGIKDLPEAEISAPRQRSEPAPQIQAPAPAQPTPAVANALQPLSLEQKVQASVATLGEVASFAGDARGASSVQTALAPQATAQPIPNPSWPAVAAQIAEVARPLPDGPIEISLQPEELGRLRLSFSPGEAGLTVTLSAERPETLDLMRRNIALLADELRQFGFDTLDFSFNDQSGSAQEDLENPTQVALRQSEDSDALTEPTATQAQPMGLAGLDIRI